MWAEAAPREVGEAGCPRPPQVPLITQDKGGTGRQRSAGVDRDGSTFPVVVRGGESAEEMAPGVWLSPDAGRPLQRLRAKGRPSHTDPESALHPACLAFRRALLPALV